MNVAPILLRNSLQLGTKANSTTLRTALLHWCCSSRNFEATPTVSAGNGTGADVENRTQDDFLKKGKEKGKGKHPNQRGVRTQHKHQHVQELWQNGTVGERLLDTRWRSIRQQQQ